MLAAAASIFSDIVGCGIDGAASIVASIQKSCLESAEITGILASSGSIAVHIVDRLVTGPHSVVELLVVVFVKNDAVAAVCEAILTPRRLDGPVLIVGCLSAALPRIHG